MIEEEPEVAKMTTPRWASTSDRYVMPGAGDAWANEAASRGRTGTQQLVAVETVTPDRGIRAALDLAEGDHAVVRRRLILEDDQPIELADSYYPGWLAEGTALAETRKIRGGAVGLLAQLGHAPTAVREHVTAERPTEADRDALHVDKDEPLLVMHRISRDAGGKAVEYVATRTVARRSPGFTYEMQVPTE